MALVIVTRDSPQARITKEMPPKAKLQRFLGGNHPLATLIEMRPQVPKLLLQFREGFHASQLSL
jgi:hypothetical protein